VPVKEKVGRESQDAALRQTVFNAEVIQLIQNFQKVANASGDSIESSDQNYVKSPPPRISEKPVKSGSFGFGTGDDIGELASDFKAALFG
jgi:hypothetical protein